MLRFVPQTFPPCVPFTEMNAALEMEMTSLLHLPPSIALSELNSALPCKEALCA